MKVDGDRRGVVRRSAVQLNCYTSEWRPKATEVLQHDIAVFT